MRRDTASFFMRKSAKIKEMSLTIYTYGCIIILQGKGNLSKKKEENRKNERRAQRWTNRKKSKQKNCSKFSKRL